MENVYGINGLPFWSEEEIMTREHISSRLTLGLKDILLATNPAWKFFQIESPLLTPKSLLNPNYTAEDIYLQSGEDNLALRPETTPGSYAAAKELLRTNKPPLVVWQKGKSFRREQDQVSKNMRLKEFYQQEYQCLFTTDTLEDYQEKVLEPLCALASKVLGVETRIIDSDRLPSYSVRTVDIEAKTPHKWLEICSISKRTDFPDKAIFQTKKGAVQKDLLVLEVAFGLDRCVHAHFE